MYAGNVITYTNIVSNCSTVSNCITPPSNATSSTTLTVPIPSTTTYVSSAAPAGWTCTPVPLISPTSVQCTDIAGLAPGASVTILVTVSTSPTAAQGTITDPTSVTATTGGTANSSGTTTVTQAVNLVVTDTAVQTAATTIAYTQTLTNLGPSTAAAGAISFTEYVQANTTLTWTPTPSGWNCTAPVSGTATCGSTPTLGATGAVTCTNTAPLAANASMTFSMTLSGTGVTGAAFCEWAGANTSNETFPPDNLAEANIAVVAMGDVDPAISAAVGTPAAGASDPTTGGTLVENFTVINNGPATITSNGGTQSLTFTFAPTNASLPENWSTYATYSSVGTPFLTATPGTAAPWTCAYASGTNTVTCTLNNGSSLAVGAANSVTIPITLKVNSNTAVGTVIEATGSVALGTGVGSYTDSTPSNNYLQAQNTVIAGVADLAWTTATAPASVVPGAASTITYTQTLTNNGPSDSLGATGNLVTVTDTFPTGTTLNAVMTVPTGWTCTGNTVNSVGPIVCTNTAMDFAAGTANAVSFSPKLNVPAGTNTPLVNTITAQAGKTTDPNLSNNNASETTVLSLPNNVDLAVVYSPVPTNQSAGNNITYNQTVTNYGGQTAAAGTVTLTETIPPNTTFVSMTTPTNWTCTPTPSATTSTFACTNTTPTILNQGTAAFTFVVQVNPGTPDGTVISDTTSVANSSATYPDPNLTNNTATAAVTVIDANTASVGIGIAGSTAVLAGNNAAYTITVTNNSTTVTATNVTVTDVIPELATDGASATQLTYFSATPSQGTCSQASGTVTCELGSMAPGAANAATINLVVVTAVPTTYIEPASVVADQQTTPQTASVETIVSAPTDVRMKSFVAGFSDGNVVLEWKTGGELHNLGFNVYREVNDTRTRLNSSLLAGSALRMKGALPQHAASSYSWIDRAPESGAVYWIEDVDVHGARTLHGPVVPQMNAVLTGLPQTRTLSQVRDPAVTASGVTASVDALSVRQLQSLAQPSSTATQQAVQNQLASGPATKIAVDSEGWYSVNLSSTMPAATSGHSYHLYAEGVEQPIRLTGQTASNEGALEFYGTGIDTPYTGTRVYWLVENSTPSLEVSQTAAPANSGVLPQSFPYTVELKQRTTYFATLMTSGNHYFGDAVASDPATTETLTVTNLAKGAPAPVITVVLQGAIDQTEHNVYVAVNNVGVGVVNFYGLEQGTFQVELPANVLVEGANTILLNALNGENDVSLLDHIDLQYGHTYTAESDALKFTAASGEHVTVSGFTQKPSRLIDITNPSAPVELTANALPREQGSPSTLRFRTLYLVREPF